MLSEMMAAHALPLEGIKNARDLGGYRTNAGTHIRPGLLLRSASLEGATQRDCSLLTEKYRVAHVIDLRSSYERKSGGNDPHFSDAAAHVLPVMNEDVMQRMDPSVATVLIDPHADPAAKLMALLRFGVIHDNLYVSFLQDNAGRQGFSAFLRILLECDANRAVLWHCTNGKDRTGLAAMLILGILGVDKETILQDYMLTNQFFASEIAAMQAMLADKLPPERTEECLMLGRGVSEKYMRRALDYIESSFGSIEGYALQALGLREAELQALRSKYTIA